MNSTAIFELLITFAVLASLLAINTLFLG